MRQHARLLVAILAAALSLTVFGCHADENDPAGQAEELSDPVRRQNAITNLQRIYSRTLADNGGERSNPAVTAVVDQFVEKLSQAYIDHPEDTQNGLAMLQLMQEMREPRTLPALLAALDWRTEVSEEHAISAANTIQYMDVPAGDKANAVSKLDAAFEKISGARGVDNRMRIAFINALGAMNDRAVTPVLVRIVKAQREDQDFLINKLAADKLADLADPAAIPALIEGLYLFQFRGQNPDAPPNRMNDAASIALVRIGREALNPMLAVLRGEDERANAVVESFVTTARQRNPNIQLDKDVELRQEACYVLGELGFAEAFEPLVAEMQAEDWRRKLNAARALARLNLSADQRTRAAELLRTAYGTFADDTQEGVGARGQIIKGLEHLYSEAPMAWLLGIARDTDVFPPLRIMAAETYAMLATKSEIGAYRQMVEREPSSADGGEKENFSMKEPALAAADACDADLACWIGKLGDSDEVVAQKAAFMLGRLGAGNEQALTALTEALGPAQGRPTVRVAILGALDFAAPSGHAAAADRIAAIAEEEEGRASWTQIKEVAPYVEARLRNRSN